MTACKDSFFSKEKRKEKWDKKIYYPRQKKSDFDPPLIPQLPTPFTEALCNSQDAIAARRPPPAALLPVSQSVSQSQDTNVGRVSLLSPGLQQCVYSVFPFGGFFGQANSNKAPGSRPRARVRRQEQRMQSISSMVAALVRRRGGLQQICGILGALC